jgi:molybdopterin/thiamine biosynthesis adenylyltransferase
MVLEVLFHQFVESCKKEFDMEYTLTFLEEDYDSLTSHLFDETGHEKAVYLLCSLSESNSENRLLVREVVYVSGEDVLNSSNKHMQIRSLSFLRAMKLATDMEMCFVFVHSHPQSMTTHSSQDDVEEAKLFKTAYIRINNSKLHASVVFSDKMSPIGRVWLKNNTTKPISKIRVVGKRFRFFTDMKEGDDIGIFDRQIRAFGKDMQILLSKLHVGVVGLGGTGSIISEQLIRLGVSELSISDGDSFENTNVNRVYGSKLSDIGKKKTEIINDLASQIGLSTKINVFDRSINYKSVATGFKSCDIIFGCTDDHLGRSILNRFPIHYLIPVIDMGVKIKSDGDKIESVEGRVTTLLPYSACLFCRGRLSAEHITAESLEAFNPEQAKERRRDGYIPELDETNPSVIPFTTNIASIAISEFLHRLSGYLGSDRTTNEIIHQFHLTELRRNSRSSSENCMCGNKKHIGKGDSELFLDLTWPAE